MSDQLKLFIDLALASSFILLAAFLINVFLQKSSAANRSRTWELTLITLLLLPGFYFLLPATSLNLVKTTADSSFVTSPGADLPGANLSAKPLLTGQNGKPSANIFSPIQSYLLPLNIWALGSLVVFLWFLVGRVGVWLIQRDSRELISSDHLDLLQDVKWELALDKNISLSSSEKTTVAITTGIIKPGVILPASFTGWSNEKLRVVLTHELAHIQRNDALFELLAKLVNILFWFNPLAWLGVYSLRAERERASDDLVLNSGTKPSQYATQLMEVASELGSAPKPLWQVATISQGSGLKNRLLCILDPKLKRSYAKKSLSSSLAIVFITLLMVTASCRIWCPEEIAGDDEKQPSPRSTGYALPEDMIDNDTVVKGKMGGQHNPDAPMEKDFSFPEGLDEDADLKLDTLLNQLQSIDEETAKNALSQLLNMGEEEFFSGLAAALESPHQVVAKTAATRLANNYSSWSWEILMGQLDHKYAAVAEIAMSSLIKSDQNTAFEACKLGFDSRHKNVRLAAMNCLSGMNGDRVNILLKQLKNSHYQDVSDYARDEILCRLTR